MMRFEKIWVEQCCATKGIKRRFGARSALDYLIGEKLPTFAGAAEQDAGFARELPRFLAAVGCVFNEYELAGYVASQRPKIRKRLRRVLYFSRTQRRPIDGHSQRDSANRQNPERLIFMNVISSTVKN